VFSRLPFVVLLSLILGCSHVAPRAASQPVSSDLSPPTYLTSIDARATPPVGWHADPLKRSPAHAHQVWISPSGHTAYGIIHFTLPVPVGYDLAVWGFLQNMKLREGEATLISKKWDPNLNGLRFVAEGGLYCVRTNLFVNGLTGWAVYAGTLRKEQINSDELLLAEQAREATSFGH
jgi:hypothetical protein